MASSRSFAELCREHDLFAITDEIYEHITFDGHRHSFLAGFEGMADRTLVVNSISKTGRSTGWRIGWVITPRSVPAGCGRCTTTWSSRRRRPCRREQLRLLRKERAFFDGIAGGYRRKRDLLVEGLRSVDFTATPARGRVLPVRDYRTVPTLAAMSPMDAAMYLVRDIGVATVPGDNFYATGNDGDRYLRFAFCRSMETLKAGIDRLRARL